VIQPLAVLTLATAGVMLLAALVLGCIERRRERERERRRRGQ
jgi:hypothetical protein